MTIWRMHIACWAPKATNTLRSCNMHCFSTATMIARTDLLMLRYKYVACLVDPRGSATVISSPFIAVNMEQQKVSSPETKGMIYRGLQTCSAMPSFLNSFIHIRVRMYNFNSIGNLWQKYFLS